MGLRVGLSNMVLLWSLFLVFSLAPSSHGFGGDALTTTHDEEAVIETFHVDDGIIDCIDVTKQLALKHPLLINHTLQMKPSYYPGTLVRSHDSRVLVGESLPRSCPGGTIPVRRAHWKNGYYSTHDTPPSRSHFYSSSNYSLLEQRNYDVKQHEHAVIQAHIKYYLGAKASINVWNPQVEQNEYSVSKISLIAHDEMTILEAGWTVNPPLYGNHQTRFYISWTTDGYKTVCYNLICPGFVQINVRIGLGSALEPVSEYGGQQYAIDVEMFKDDRSGNWWVYLQGEAVGYWPKELFLSLEQGAEFVDFGGEVLNLRSSGGHTSTEMGSGHLPYEGFRKSSFFKNVQCLNREYVYQPPSFIRDLSEKRDCYAVQPGSAGDVSGAWGYFFFYGGAGRVGRCQ